MAFLFKRNPKTPTELVRALNEQVTKFDNPNTTYDRRKVQDDCARYLTQIKTILHGGDEDSNPEPQPDQIALLAQEVYQSDLLYNLINNLNHLEFDSRKDVSALFATLLRRQIPNKRSPTLDYLLAHKKVLILLLRGPEIPEICLITGAILRDCIKLEPIASIILQDSYIWKYFEYSSKGTFENMTDCFQTLYELLTLHKKLVSEWLLVHSDELTIHINKLISSNNYVTKRQSIKLLSQLILTRTNNQFMIKYVNNPENLKLVMILLSDKSKNLQLESFNVFKVFVANPKKGKQIQDILIKNREKLLFFLENFNPLVDKNNDSNFKDEKEFVVQQITDLPRLISTSNSSTNILNTGSSSNKSG